MKKFILSVVIISNFFWLTETKAQVSPVRSITFPVIGSVTYWDDFGAPRDGGARQHKGNDLMGRKLLPLVSAVDGTVVDVDYPEETWGYSVTIRDADGYTYHYIHINNDNPGTDDDKGGGANAYAVDIQRGNRVVAGQLIGYMGDSGNAETTPAHLHFEIRLNGEPFSPYQSLKAAKKIMKPVDRPIQSNEILPYGGFEGGAAVAVGNLDADADVEIVTAAGPGGGPHIQVFDKGSQTAKSSFFAYTAGFKGGVDLTLADLDGDGVDEIITAPGKGGGPNVKVFQPDGSPVLNFMAYDPKFLGGIKISAADLNNDGKAEIVTIPMAGGGPHVKIFQPNGSIFWEFFAYDVRLRMGWDIAASKNGIATVPLIGGGPHVKVFDAGGGLKSEFMAYDENHKGGVRLAMDGSFVYTAPLNGGPDFRKYDLTGMKLDGDTVFEPWWNGSWDISVDNGTAYVSTGPNTRRRTSVRELDFEQNRRFRTPQTGD
ncbi:MAG: VCBS repeat domain-containing M23 family metallopeptidase [Candidatus Doudnabacteria bacterium]|nr:VCBS repeat domain-containing M23 family metallopeptidase [Candidatus Doudnabacteria bacterium]